MKNKRSCTSYPRNSLNALCKQFLGHLPSTLPAFPPPLFCRYYWICLPHTFRHSFNSVFSFLFQISGIIVFHKGMFKVFMRHYYRVFDFLIGIYCGQNGHIKVVFWDPVTKPAKICCFVMFVEVII